MSEDPHDTRREIDALAAEIHGLNRIIRDLEAKAAEMSESHRERPIRRLMDEYKGQRERAYERLFWVARKGEL